MKSCMKSCVIAWFVLFLRYISNIMCRIADFAEEKLASAGVSQRFCALFVSHMLRKPHLSFGQLAFQQKQPEDAALKQSRPLFLFPLNHESKHWSNRWFPAAVLMSCGLLPAGCHGSSASWSWWPKKTSTWWPTSFNASGTRGSEWWQAAPHATALSAMECWLWARGMTGASVGRRSPRSSSSTTPCDRLWRRTSSARSPWLPRSTGSVWEQRGWHHPRSLGFRTVDSATQIIRRQLVWGGIISCTPSLVFHKTNVMFLKFWPNLTIVIWRCSWLKGENWRAVILIKSRPVKWTKIPFAILCLS